MNRGNRLTLMSAISIKKVELALYGEWSANGVIFLYFIEKLLRSKLRKGKVFVMDNVAFHQAKGVREASEKTGARLIYLPSYSPDLNPIEQMWSKIKNCLGRASARSLNKFRIYINFAYKV